MKSSDIKKVVKQKALATGTLPSNYIPKFVNPTWECFIIGFTIIQPLYDHYTTIDNHYIPIKVPITSH